MAIHWEPVGDGRVLAVSDDHRFGTDTVILSYFAAPQTAGEAVCDLGTGCGCIPFLLLNQPVAPRRILGVDKQPDAIMLCRLSADKNKLHGLLQFAEADWCFPKSIAAAGSFDRVICNPPYFQDGSGRKSSNAAHAAARHGQLNTLTSLCAAARYLLRYGGHFCLCHRPERVCRAAAKLLRAEGRAVCAAAKRFCSVAGAHRRREMRPPDTHRVRALCSGGRKRGHGNLQRNIRKV